MRRIHLSPILTLGHQDQHLPLRMDEENNKVLLSKLLAKVLLSMKKSRLCLKKVER
uniref:Uncharacterized protein n=1 Tax=Solanum lycopersicum TaxID=4081 RepID=A0A3Q7EE36_SOLLC